MKQVYLYGIGGADDGFRVIRYCAIDQDELSVLTITHECITMRTRYRSIQRFFLMDNRPGLARLCAKSIKAERIEDAIIFLDILERNGLEVKI